MAIREIIFNVSDSGAVTPTAPQDGGVQGEHNAATVTFVLPSNFVSDDYFYRIDCRDTVGHYDTTGRIDPSVSEGKSMLCTSIPSAWTRYGGMLTLSVVVSQVIDGTEEKTIFSADGRVSLAARNVEDSEVKGGLSALIQDCEETTAECEKLTTKIKNDLEAGELHGRSGVYVGAGDMPPDCNVQIDPTGDPPTAGGHKFLFIGDSYTAGSALEEGKNTWVEHVAQFLNLKHEIQYFKYAQPGASFGCDVNSGYNFNVVLKRAVLGNKALTASQLTDDTLTKRFVSSETLSPEQCKEITNIFVACGCNDWQYDREKIANGMKAFNTVLKQYFPNAKVWLFYVGWAKSHEYRQGLKDTYYSYDGIAPQLGYVCFNTLYRLLHNKNRMSDDGVHPNAEGQWVLALSIANALYGSSDVLDSAKYHYVKFGNITCGRAYHNCNNIIVHIEPGSVVLDSPTDIVGDKFTKLFDVSCDILFGGAKNNVVSQFTNHVVLNAAKDSNAHLKAATLLCQLVKYDEKSLGLYARTAEVVDGEFITHQGTESISFFNNSITIPIWDA